MYKVWLKFPQPKILYLFELLSASFFGNPKLISYPPDTFKINIKYGRPVLIKFWKVVIEILETFIEA